MNVEQKILNNYHLEINLFKSLSEFLSEPSFLLKSDGSIISTSDKFNNFFALTKEISANLSISLLAKELFESFNKFKDNNDFDNFCLAKIKINYNLIDEIVDFKFIKLTSSSEFYFVIITNNQRILNSTSDNDFEKKGYLSILDNSPTLIWKSDCSGKIVFYNKSFIKYFGEDKFENSLPSKEQLVLKDDYESYINKFHSNLNKNSQFESIYRLRNYRDEYRWVKEVVIPFKKSNDLQDGFVGYCYDIDEQYFNDIIKNSFFEIVDRIFSVNDLDILFEKLFVSLMNIMHIDNIYYGTIDYYNNKFETINYKGKNQDYPKSLKLGKCLLDHVIDKNQSKLFFKDEILKLKEEGRILFDRSIPECWMGIPIKIFNDLQGIIVIESTSKDFKYSNDNMKSMEFVAEQISLFIQRIKDKDKIVATQDKFKYLFVNLNDSIAYNKILYNEDGIPINYIITEVNYVYQNHFDVNPEQIINIPILDFENPDHHTSHFDYYIEVVKSNQSRSFERYEPRTNKTFSTSIYPLSADEFITINKDISNETKAFRELDKQRLQVQQILDISEVIIGLIDFDGTIRMMNRKGLELLGYSHDEIIGNNWFQLIRNDDFVVAFNQLKEEFVKSHSKSINKIELIVPTKKNEEKTIYFQNVILTDDDDKGIGVLFSGIDITDRKNFESDIIEAKKKAEEASNLKTVILGNLSHELRTPLNGILGFAQLLNFEVEGNEEAKEMADLIYKSGIRLMNTINSMLTLTEIESNNLYINLEKSKLAKLLEYYSSTYKDMVNDRHLDYELIIKDEDIECYIDEYLFNQIFFNLVDNACKYTNAGSIKIILDSKMSDGLLWGCITISDTGVGISEEQSKHIFKAFRQGSEGIDRSFEGVGLGLTLTEKMVNKLYGKIEFTSTVNVGTQFTVSFLSIE